VTLGAFLTKGSLKCARYGVPPIEVWVKRSGTCYAEQSSPADEVVARALALLQKSEHHCVLRAFQGSTSEDIAFWCKTGKSRAAVPNEAGGTNYNRGRTSCAQEYASKAGVTHGPEIPASSSHPSTEGGYAANTSIDEATLPSPREEVADKRAVKDPDAFLLLHEESNAEQQLQTPQSIRRVEVPSDDEDLEDFEVVDLPPWLPAEHYLAAVNAA
jgi:hypothetical protein